MFKNDNFPQCNFFPTLFFRLVAAEGVEPRFMKEEEEVEEESSEEEEEEELTPEEQGKLVLISCSFQFKLNLMMLLYIFAQ